MGWLVAVSVFSLAVSTLDVIFFASGSRFLPPRHVLTVVAIGWGIAIWNGILCATTPDPWAMEARLTLRRATRACLMLLTLTFLVYVLVGRSLGPAVSRLLLIAALAVVYPAAVVLLMLSLIQLTLRLPDRPLAVQTLAYTFSFLLISALSPLIKYGPWLLSATGITTVEALVAGNEQLILTLLTAMAVANLLVTCWGLVVLVRIRQAFVRTASQRARN